jgi:HD-like signal output (HDOD) protein
VGSIPITRSMLKALRRFLDRNDAPAEAPVEEPAVPEPTQPEPTHPEPASTPDASQTGTLPHVLTREEVFGRLHALAFGITPADPPASPAHAAVASSTRAALAQAVTEPRYTPRRPLLLPQLMHAVNDDNVSRRELATLIVRDPAMTSNLLKLANAPFYRVSSQPVESIDRAIALIGTQGIRSLIATAIMQPVFQVAGGEFARFPEITWEHTFRSGTAAAAYAAMIAHDDPFAAQLLALLTGLATIIVFRVALDQYSARPPLRADVTVVARLLDAHTHEVAHEIAASWELSARILSALDEQAPTDAAPERSPLGGSLRFGRLAGALSLLLARGDIRPGMAKAALLNSESGDPRLDGIWTRLSAPQRKAD